MRNKNIKIDSKKKNIFTSKSDVLQFLQPLIKKSKIEKSYDFSISNWKKNKKQILNYILKNFSKKKIIVRSSAIGEDALDKSEAGNYKSFLNINSNSKTAVKNAIESVIRSYKKKNNFNIKNQILIQTQTNNILRNGVVMTYDSNGSPYYIINYDDGGSTTLVTGGKVGKTIKIFRKIKFKKYDVEWKKLIESIKEIQLILKNDFLDIEFAITKKDEIVLFQVRPLTFINKSIIKNIDNKIDKCIIKNKKKLIKLKNESNLQIKTIFSDMTDWNPAEIIGNNPNHLDYSLYDYLIMKNVWNIGRVRIGYQKVEKPDLMTKFGNKPYVDVKKSFASLIPEQINNRLKKKLLNYYLQKLFENPHLHDKAEFEILLSCYDFSFKQKVNELKKYGFTNIEIKKIESSLIEFTNKIINNFTDYSRECDNAVEKMTKNRDKIRIKLQYSKRQYRDHLVAAENLLIDCKRLGTLPFSTMARISFVGTILLKSLINQKKIDFKFYEKFMENIETPVTKFQRDSVNYNNKKLSKKEFLKKYGHLRPGTYDITALRYDQNDLFFESIGFRFRKKQKPITIRNDLQEKLAKYPIDFRNIDLLSFVKKSLTQRENLKFEFTKNLSDALEYISKAGNELGYEKSELVNLDIKTILHSYKKLNHDSLRKLWIKKIKQNKNFKNINEHLILSPIIFSENDFDILKYYFSKPNFITSKSVKSKIILLDQKNNVFDLDGKIVLIENADPGYDWIFTKNPVGLITKYGGIASHMAIRCGEIGLPAAIGCGELIYENLKKSTKILLDCKNQQINILENIESDEYIEERKILKSLGYIK